MELNTKQISRCNKMMYFVVLFLCSFYIMNVPLYWFNLHRFIGELVIVPPAVMILSSVIYMRFKENFWTRYAISGLFFINYVVTLCIFEDLSYFDYMFAIMFGVFMIAINIFSSFMKESREEVLGEANKNKETAERAIFKCIY